MATVDSFGWKSRAADRRRNYDLCDADRADGLHSLNTLGDLRTRPGLRGATGAPGTGTFRRLRERLILEPMSAATSRYRIPRLVASAVGVVLGISIVVLSFIPAKPIYPSWLVGVVLVSSFPLFGWAVIERAGGHARGARRRRSNDFSAITNEDYNRMWSPFLDASKRHKGTLLLAVIIVGSLWAIMMSSIATLRGQPEHDQAGYYLNDHGSRVPVSRAGYEAALAKQDRLFAAGATIFLAVAAGLTTYQPRAGTGQRSSPT